MQNAELLVVKTAGTCSYRSVLKNKGNICFEITDEGTCASALYFVSLCDYTDLEMF
jgi:hypothetical protein